MEGFIRWLLALSASGTVLGLIVLIIGRALKKKLPSSAVYALWIIVALRFILPLPGLVRLPGGTNVSAAVSVSSAAPEGEVSDDVSPIAIGSNKSEADTARDIDAQTPSLAPQTASESASGRADYGLAENIAEAVPQAAKAAPLYKRVEFRFGVWALGFVLSFSRTIIEFWRFRRQLSRSLKPASYLEASILNALNASPYPALYRSGRVDTTLLMGLIRPVIVLPDRDYSSEALDGILRHELIHYRRGDLTLKWLITFAQSVHWFNPVFRLFAAKATLYCELSCDERLLKGMNGRERQFYGETLLSVAQNRALPRGIMAVSFATEKRDLKERLVQIMSFKKFGKKALALTMILALTLCAGAWALGPRLWSLAEDEVGNAGASDDEITQIRVTNISELIAAIGNNREITLAAGKYNLSDYSAQGAYLTNYEALDFAGDGGLTLSGIKNLTLIGEDGAEIITEPREANVISLDGCRDIALINLSVGHTVRPELCEGAVINISSSGHIDIYSCDLYGCGTVGVDIWDSWNVNVYDSVIRECSVSAIQADYSANIKLMGLNVYSCGAKSDGGMSVMSLVYARDVSNLGVYNCSFSDNSARSFADLSGSGIELMGNTVKNNNFGALFELGSSVTIEGCEFTDNFKGAKRVYSASSTPAVTADLKELSADDILAMEYKEHSFTEVEAENSAYDDDQAIEYHVSSADEFVEAIGPNRTIYIEGTLLLSDAGCYGKGGSEYYYWAYSQDGWTLTIVDCPKLKIVGEGSDKTRIETLPRGADVLAFKGCDSLTVEGITMGHIRGAGSCVGDVIHMISCDRATLNDMGLYGCGVNGISALSCENLRVSKSEIYECSGYGAYLVNCIGAVFEEVDIHDCEESFYSIPPRG